MAVIIKNLTSRPIYVSLHRGENLRLPPNGASDSVDEVEVKGNAAVEKLLRQRMIAVEPAAKRSAEAKAEAVGADNNAADGSQVGARTRPESLSPPAKR